LLAFAFITFTRAKQYFHDFILLSSFDIVSILNLLEQERLKVLSSHHPTPSASGHAPVFRIMTDDILNSALPFLGRHFLVNQAPPGRGENIAGE
jgi:hypothetical protein